MFPVNTYREIERIERSQGEKHIIVLLFVRPDLPGAQPIIASFNYLHYNAGTSCNIYAVGYGELCGEQRRDCRLVRGIDGKDWYFSDQAFVEFKDELERRLKWRYSGDIELIVLQSNPDSPGRSALNFENYLAIDVHYGVKNGYIESFQRFMEQLVRASKREVEVRRAAAELSRSNFHLAEIAASAIDSCKKVPQPVRKLIRDRLFYRTSRSYSS